MSLSVEQLEKGLDSFDAAVRKESLAELLRRAESGEIELADPQKAVNMHYHTFFSYNAAGYSPSSVAWRARKAGLSAAGIVDFDVLEGVDEFLDAAETVGIRGACGLETRVFVPEFADKEISSPGEPGIAYHMGVGFTNSRIDGKAAEFRDRLQGTVQRRNRELTDRVNAYLNPVELDYDKDVIPLTPAGNPTERHLCEAYAKKAAEIFSDESKLPDYWRKKLGDDVTEDVLGDSAKHHGLIRKKTMKKGGVGYVQPDAGSFPKMSDMNEFVLAAGAIPTHTWLNGLSDGEQEIERLLEVSLSSGAAAINIIPDRNYTPGEGTKDIKCQKLNEVIELAGKLSLPVVVGTEMNSPGLKFVDDFESQELKPFVDIFLKGAYIVYAHTVLQSRCGAGYLSDWAENSFGSTDEKNDFYFRFAEAVKPGEKGSIDKISAEMTPNEILKIVSI